MWRRYPPDLLPSPWKGFRAKVDWWLFTLLMVVLGVATALVAQGVLNRPGPATWSILFLATALDIFILWILLRSRYEVGPEGLRAWLGPLRWTFPPERIAGVRRGDWRHLFSGPGRLRLALSVDNLVVEVEGGWVREVVLSPLEKRAFLDALREVASHARIPPL